MKSKIIIYVSAFYILLCVICEAQWQTDIRLTNDPAESRTSFGNAWCIAANADIVHVLWFDFRNGNPEIYYKRSTDSGLNWGADIRLTNNSAYSRLPSVSVSGSIVHVVWEDNRDGNYEIYYKRSADFGINWGADTRLTNNSASSGVPSCSVSGSVVHVVWWDNRDAGSEIYYKRSTDSGISWTPDIRLTNNFSDSGSPSVSVSGSVVHVVWHDNRDGNYEIYYKRSSDTGATWGTDTRLTNDPASSFNPSLWVSGSVVHVVWHDYRDGGGNTEVYYKRSSDAGISWSADTRLTNDPAPSIAYSVSTSGSVVHVVWIEGRDGNAEIYYKRSTDGGVSWGADIRLTNNSANSFSPSISLSGSVVHVVWHDDRDGNWEIYYKQDPTGNPIGIKPLWQGVPEAFKLEQNYPNPFNPVTMIRFDVPSPIHINLMIYDILGQEVETLVNELLKPGTYEVDFDGTNLTTGVYFYVLKTDGYRAVKKMTLLK